MWIFVGVGVGFLALIVLIDQRKKIFKKHPKKEKKQKEKRKEEIKQVQEEKQNLDEISFEESKKPKIPQFEYLDIKDDLKMEYTPSTSQRQNRNNFRRPFDGDRFNRERRAYKKKSIKQQIKDLSPEMKAILLSNALGKKVHF